MASQNNTVLSIVFILIGMSIFSLQDVMIRLISDDVSTFQILFTRSVVGSLLLILFLKFRKIPIIFRTQYLFLTIVRTFIFLFGFVLFYIGLANLSLAIATALFFTSPFFVTVLSKIFLNEVIGIRRWLTVAFGFIGVVIIADPSTNGFNYFMIFPILCSICYASAMLIIKVTSEEDTVYSQTFHFYLMAMFLCPICAFMGNIFNLHDPNNQVLDFMFRPWSYGLNQTTLIMLFIGLTAVMAFVLVISAYRIGKPFVVAPFEYILLVWAVIYGRIIWGEIIPTQSWIGMFIIVAGGIYIFYREKVNNQKLSIDKPLR